MSKITLEFTEKQYWKLREVVENAQDGASSLGNYATPELQDLQAAIMRQQVFEETASIE